MTNSTQISTWFVADSVEDATFFPQVGTRSDNAASQATYWRCVICHFASSSKVNPGTEHVFYTNAPLPVVDGVSVDTALSSLGVRVVNLPITYRLKGVTRWGNQFYILDIIKHIARSETASRYVVLDSDCIWTQPAAELEKAIDAHGVLTYEIDYAAERDINGATRMEMTALAASLGAQAEGAIPYFGGEFFAAAKPDVVKLAERIDDVWPLVSEGQSKGVREEAHFLSILYAILGYEHATANAFIRRMWTALSMTNVETSDLSLMIWHLPAEKKTGFRRLFRDLADDLQNARSLTLANYSKVMGVPRRSLWKWCQDLSAKLREKLGKFRRLSA